MIENVDATFMARIGLLFCLAVVTCVIALSIRISRSRSRQRDAELAAQWEWVQTEAALGNGHLAYVQSVYQRARRGSKAVIVWDGVSWGQDAWFWHWCPPVGAFVLVQGSKGWGPHNQNPSVFYVHQHQVLAVIPGDAPMAHQRHQVHAGKNSPAS